MSNSAKLTLLWTLVLVLIAGFVYGQVPQLINYQGRLTDNFGDPVTDSNYVVTFRVWDDSAIGANILWEEEDTILTNNGLFSLFLGKNNQLPDSVFSEANRYLGIQISGQGEIYPRTQFTSVPYVYRVSTVDGASGGNISGNVEIDGHVGIGMEPLESYVLAISRGPTDIGGLVSIIDSSSGASVYIEKIDDGPGLWISNKGSDGIGIYNDIEAGVGLSIIQKGNSPALDIREDTTGGAGILLTVESDGEVGIGNHPSEKLEVSGTIYSNTGGFRFPDGSIQSTAAFNEDPQWIVSDSVLYTRNYLGITRGGAGNIISGDSMFSMINLGSASETGPYPHATIGGGLENIARGSWSTIAGGWQNTAEGPGASISGGTFNSASGPRAVIAGGSDNSASGQGTNVSGGFYNEAVGFYSAVTGGAYNKSLGAYSSVTGGNGCTAQGQNSSVSGGTYNYAEGQGSIISGGHYNYVAGDYSTILGGYADSILVDAEYSCLFGIRSTLTQDSTFMVDMPHIRFGNEINGYEFPESDGDSGYVMMTDGSGQLSWTDAINGSGTTGIIPIGSVTAWLKSFPNTPPLPDNFVECNGQTLSDAESPFDGQIIPDLNGDTGEQRFLRGGATSGAIGGSESHSHGTRNYCIEHQSTAGFNQDADHLPPYYEVVWIIRVK